MKKRSVLAPVKKIETPVESTEPPPEKPDLDDKEIFELPKAKASKPVATPLPDVEPPTPTPPEPEKTPRQKRDYTYLKEARQKSLETRRKKAEEKKRMEEELNYYRGQVITQQPAPQPIVQPQPPAPQPVDERPAMPTTTASVNPRHDMSHQMFDYDKLISGVADRLSQQNEYFSQLEKDIRADERKKAEATYQEQLKQWEQQQHRQHQREQAFSAMSGSYRRNHVFDRSSRIRQQYTDRYKNSWY